MSRDRQPGEEADVAAVHLGMVTGRVAGDALDLVDEPSRDVPLPELTPQ